MFVFFSGSKSLETFFIEPVPADDLGFNDCVPPSSNIRFSFPFSPLPVLSIAKKDEEVEIEII